jgi:lysophospholipase L1-like esterase
MPIRTATALLCGALALLVGNPIAAARTALPCAPFTSAALPPPSPRVTAWPVKRFQAINEQVRNTPHRVLFLGDSLVERFPREALRVWREHMEPRGVLNAGITGDRTENLLWRLHNGNLGGSPPSLAILLLGADDLAPDGKPRPPELTAEGIRANLLYLRRRLPGTPILLLGLPPRGASPDSEPRRKVVAVNRLISGCADRRSVFHADIGGALLDARGGLMVDVSPDGLHLGETGYARLAPLLAAMIDNLIERR